MSGVFPISAGSTARRAGSRPWRRWGTGSSARRRIRMSRPPWPRPGLPGPAVPVGRPSSRVVAISARSTAGWAGPWTWRWWGSGSRARGWLRTSRRSRARAGRGAPGRRPRPGSGVVGRRWGPSAVAAAVVGGEDADGEVGVAEWEPERRPGVATRATRLGHCRTPTTGLGGGGSAPGLVGVVPAVVAADEAVVEARHAGALERHELGAAPRCPLPARGRARRLVGGARVPPAAVRPRRGRVGARHAVAGHAATPAARPVRPSRPAAASTRPGAGSPPARRRATRPVPSARRAPPGRRRRPLRTVAGLVGAHVPGTPGRVREHLPRVLHGDERLVRAPRVRVRGPGVGPPGPPHHVRIGPPLGTERREQVDVDVTAGVVVNAGHDEPSPVRGTRVRRGFEPCRPVPRGRDHPPRRQRRAVGHTRPVPTP